MVELKALKMIQAKNYKHLAFDIDIGESSKTGQVHSSTHKLYWVMPLQLCACVCVCVCVEGMSLRAGVSSEEGALVGRSSLCYSKREEGRDLPGEREI